MNKKILKWGILGTGTISNVVTPSINKVRGNYVHAVASRSLEKARTFAEKFQIPTCYDNYQALLDDPDIDVVYLALPNALHKEWAIRAAKAKKHILCEKPFAFLPKDIEETLKIIKNEKVFFMEAFMFRCHPQLQKLVDIIKQDKIGSVKYIHAALTYPFNEERDFEAHMNPDLKGGALINLGYYCISMAQLIAKITNQYISAEEVKIVIDRKMEKAEGIVNTSTAILTFANSLTATVMTSGKFGVIQNCFIVGDKGTISMPHPWVPNRQEEIIITYTNVKLSNYDTDIELPIKTEIIKINSEYSVYENEIEMVYNCIINNKQEVDEPGPTWQSMLDDTILINKWYEQVFGD